MWALFRKVVQSMFVLAVAIAILMPYILGSVLHAKYKLVDQQLLDDFATSLKEKKLVSDDFQLLLTKESYGQGYFNSKALLTVSVLGNTYQKFRAEGLPTDFQFSITAEHLFDIRLQAKLETFANHAFYQKVFLEPNPYIMRAHVSLFGNISVDEQLSSINYIRGTQQFMLIHASGAHQFRHWQLSELSYQFPQISLKEKGVAASLITFSLSAKLTNIEQFMSSTTGVVPKQAKKATNMFDAFSLNLKGSVAQNLINKESQIMTAVDQLAHYKLINKDHNYYHFHINLQQSNFILDDNQEVGLMPVVMSVLAKYPQSQVLSWFN